MAQVVDMADDADGLDLVDGLRVGETYDVGADRELAAVLTYTPSLGMFIHVPS